ncbi:MAG: hypothetical protein H0X24_25025, partial [Ktedonobacterales bacterium]|nr:hypothetical protein [Ktedonobacterales bacterium]
MPQRDNRPSPLGPEPGRTTAPLPNSPYAGGGGYAPPPPPAPIYTAPPMAPPPTAYGGISGVYPQAPRVRAPKSRGGSFIVGVLAAIVVIAVLAGVGLAALNGGLAGKGATAVHPGTTPAPGVATTAPGTTPVPTLAPTFTPTEVPPTVAPSPNPHSLPPPPPGFINYLPQNDDWGLNYRIGTQIHAQSGALPLDGQNVNAIIFDEGHDATFTVYDLSQAIPADQGQTIFDAVTQTLHAEDVQILEQKLTQVGANAWEEVHLRTTISGVRYEAYCFYAPHGTGANAVSMLAPAGDGFAAINTS